MTLMNTSLSNNEAVLTFPEYSEKFLALSGKWLRDQEICRLVNAPPFSEANQKEWFASLKNRNDYLIWGICLGERKIGACGLKHIAGDAAEYWGYIGEKDLWGRRLGRQLIEHCIGRARELGLHRLYLKVIPENLRARKLYERQGFMASAEENGEIVMTLLLDDSTIDRNNK